MTPVQMSVVLHQAPALWVIPIGGEPHSLGVISVSAVGKVRLEPERFQYMRPGVTLAITVDQPGGSSFANLPVPTLPAEK